MSKEPNTLNQPAAKPSRSVLFGAAFLMATSAIGPGFLTQTSTFTAQHGAALALIIVMAIIMDITAQMNIWSVVTVSKMRAQDVCTLVWTISTRSERSVFPDTVGNARLWMII